MGTNGLGEEWTWATTDRRTKLNTVIQKQLSANITSLRVQSDSNGATTGLGTGLNPMNSERNTGVSSSKLFIRWQSHAVYELQDGANNSC